MNGEKEKDEMESTLVDYFVVAGYDPETGLVAETEPSLDGCSTPDYDNGYGTAAHDAFRTPMQKSYSARILEHFPQKRPNCPFSREIISLCMPKGLRFYTEKEVPIRPVLHTFANIKEDGSRVNGTALTFFEEVRDAQLCEAMTALHMEHVKELTARERHLERNRLPPGTVSGGTHTLPRGRRGDRHKRISYYDGGGHVLYMSKTLCLITRLPMVTSTVAILRALMEMIKGGEQPPLALESYIYWFLNEVPLPSPGTTLKVSLHTWPLVVQRPSSRELPFFDHSLGELFRLIPVERFLKLFTCFLLEHQILVCSKELSRLMLVCESLCALAFPFRWQMAYVPILPTSQLKFVEAPVPFVMGVCYEDAPPERLFQSNICVADIDTGRFELPEDLPAFPQAKHLVHDIRQCIERFAVWEDPVNPLLARRPSTVSTGTVTEGGGEGEEEERPPPPPPHRRPPSGARRKDDWSSKRMSRSFDHLDEEADRVERRPSRAGLLPLQLDGLRGNDAVQRVTEIARRAGVVVEMRSVEAELREAAQDADSPVARQYFKEVKLNNAVRECVMNRMACMLYAYEHFVIGGQGCADRETFEASRESLVCFDKASFLSDQPDSHLPFLAAFLETQMFTSFIDAKILAQWGEPDEQVVLFDARISDMRERLGLSMVRTPTSDATPPFAHTEELISKREDSVDYVVPPPHPIAGTAPANYGGVWPELNCAVLEGSEFLSPAPSPWKQRYPRLRPKAHERPLSVRPTSTYGGLLPSSSGSGGPSEPTPSQIAQQNIKFVDQLLRETKGKTKRLLVNKMGREAVQLGHVDEGITGVEENTLVASFCDLLERIWAHGLIKKQGKSALWTYVLQHNDVEKAGLSQRSMSSSMLTPAPSPVSPQRPPPGHSGTLPRPSQLSQRAPSLPPVPPTHQRVPYRNAHQRSQPPARPPPPVPVEKKEEEEKNENANTLSELVESIRGEWAKEEGGEEQPAWSRSILRAANFLADKIASQVEQPEEEERVEERRGRAEEARGARGRSVNRAGEAIERLGEGLLSAFGRDRSTTRGGGGGGVLKKSTSVSDFATPGWSAQSGYASDGGSVEGSPRHRSSSRQRSPDRRVVLPALPTCIAYDLKNVLRMSEIKTDLGYARAFVRLALERKLLHKHITTILANSRLLGDAYKQYAFVRCEDEREQFLFHILSLNAAQFRCFTNTFTKTKMDYQVIIVTGAWRGALPPVWLIVQGTLAASPAIHLPAATPLFKFDHKNLGVLSTLRIGHAPGVDKPPKWFLDYIIVRNEITGQMYRFPCGRWFGRGVDDGSLERLLVAEALLEDTPTDSEPAPPGSPAVRARRRAPSRSQTPTGRDRSPSQSREEKANGAASGGKKSRMAETEQALGGAVNALVKHFLSPEPHSRAQLAQLLAGERGLVHAIEAAFQFGRQDNLWTARLFRQHYPWDYIEKVTMWFLELFRRGGGEKLTRAQKDLIVYSIKLVQRIADNQQLGKDGRFHVFVLISIRDHVLSGFVQLMAWTPVTAQLFDESSLLRSPAHLSYLSKLLDSLNEFHFQLEPALTYGIV